MDKKQAFRLERVFKGVSNKWRIRILELIAQHELICVDEVTDKLKCNNKTISEHIRRLKIAGLVNKRYHGTRVEHSLTPYGKKMLKIFKQFSNS